MREALINRASRNTCGPMTDRGKPTECAGTRTQDLRIKSPLPSRCKPQAHKRVAAERKAGLHAGLHFSIGSIANRPRLVQGHKGLAHACPTLEGRRLSLGLNCQRFGPLTWISHVACRCRDSSASSHPRWIGWSWRRHSSIDLLGGKANRRRLSRLGRPYKAGLST